MLTIREVLDIQKNGKNTIKEEKEFDEIVECIDDFTGAFIGSKRAEKYLALESGDFVDGLKKAINCIKIYEKKALNEEEMNSSAARVLLYDVHKYLKESYNILTDDKKDFPYKEKENLCKVFGSIMFEMHELADKYDIMLEEIITDDEMFEGISNDMAKIISEVL